MKQNDDGTLKDSGLLPVIRWKALRKTYKKWLSHFGYGDCVSMQRMFQAGFASRAEYDGPVVALAQENMEKGDIIMIPMEHEGELQRTGTQDPDFKDGGTV